MKEKKSGLFSAYDKDIALLKFIENVHSFVLTFFGRGSSLVILIPEKKDGILR